MRPLLPKLRLRRKHLLRKLLRRRPPQRKLLLLMLRLHRQSKTKLRPLNKATVGSKVRKTDERGS